MAGGRSSKGAKENGKGKEKAAGGSGSSGAVAKKRGREATSTAENPFAPTQLTETTAADALEAFR